MFATNHSTKSLLRVFTTSPRICLFSNKVRFTVYPEGFKDTKKLEIEAVEGENLMEVILDNKQWGVDLEEFGLCGKELSCHTCRVNFIKGYDKLIPPAEEEEDVF